MMKIELIDRMGTDLSVVNAARVSYAKTKEVFDDKDEKLIKYLACLLYTSPSPRDQRGSRMPSSA